MILLITFTALCGLICSLLCIQSVAWPSSYTPKIIFFLTLSRSVESNNFLDKDLPTHYHHAHFAFETKFTRYRLCKPSVEGNSLLGTCAVLRSCCVSTYGFSRNLLLFTSMIEIKPILFNNWPVTLISSSVYNIS